MQTQPSARIPLLEQFGVAKADLGGYWNFADVIGSMVVDLSGHGNTVKLTDKRMQAEGPVAGTKALSLSPKQYVEIANREQLWGHSQFTINFWMRLREQQNITGSLITKCAPQPSDFRIQFGPAPNFVIASQKIGWYTSPNSVNNVWTYIDNSDIVDRWMMLTISFDGQRIRSYVDGKLDTESSPIDPGKLNNSASPMRIGSEPAYNIPGFDGWITELAVIKRALAADELASIYSKYCVELHQSGAAGVEVIPSGIASVSSAKMAVLKGTDPVFEQPGAEYRMGQYIMGCRPNFQELQNYGIGTAVLGLPNGNYLHNERAWDDVLANLDDAMNRKMGAWIFDEDMYPSGAAGGLTVDGHPEYASYGVYQITQPGKGRKSLAVNLPKDALRLVAAVLYPVVNGKIRYKNGIAVPFSATTATTEGMDGDWAFCVYVAKKMLGIPDRRDSWFNHGEYPNLLNADAVKRYITITHEAYKQRFGSRFRYVTAFYTNEPSLNTVTNFAAPVTANSEAYLPWDDSIQQAFRAGHGYDLAPCLAAMYLPQSDEGNIIRRHFWQTVGNLMSKNCFRQIADWCAKNGGSLSGHLLLEEWMSSHVSLYGNFMQSMENFKIAGYDHQFNRHGISQSNNLMMQKYSLSGNRAHGNFVAQALIEPILSGYLDAGSSQLRLIPISVYRKNINMMCAGGVSIINSYVNYNAYPVDEFRNVTDYAARLCYFLRGARDMAKVAVYYPIETFQGRCRPTQQNVFATSAHPEYQPMQKKQDALFEAMFRQNIGFNLLDADAIDHAQIANRALQIAGYEYKVMIMPDMDIIPLATLQKLLRFVLQGGMLIWSGKIPTLGDSEAETPQVRKLLAGARTTGDLKRIVSSVRKLGDGGLVVTASRPDRFYYVPYLRNIDGQQRKIFLLVNDHSGTNTLKIGGRGKGVLYDPWKGEYASVTLPFSVGVGAYSAMVLVME